MTGQAVPQATDSRVERLRDALMDDARERVDDLGEDLVVGVQVAIQAESAVTLTLATADILQVLSAIVMHPWQITGTARLLWLMLHSVWRTFSGEDLVIGVQVATQAESAVALILTTNIVAHPVNVCSVCLTLHSKTGQLLLAIFCPTHDQWAPGKGGDNDDA